MLSVGAELFHASGQTDGRADKHEEVNIAVGNFANAPKNQFTMTPKYHITRVTAKLNGICSITQNFQFVIFRDQNISYKPINKRS